MAGTKKIEELLKAFQELRKKHIGFKNLEHKLESEGHSAESAGNIAAAIGRKKYGAKHMAEMAHKNDDPADAPSVIRAVKELTQKGDEMAQDMVAMSERTGMPEGTVAKKSEEIKAHKNGQWYLDSKKKC